MISGSGWQRKIVAIPAFKNLRQQDYEDLHGIQTQSETTPLRDSRRISLDVTYGSLIALTFPGLALMVGLTLVASLTEAHGGRVVRIPVAFHWTVIVGAMVSVVIGYYLFKRMAA